MIGKIDAVPEKVARAAVRGFAGNPGLSDFLAGRVAGSWPLAVVPDRVLSQIGGRSRTLRLSSETAASHPRFSDFEREDWLRVQRILDEGRVFHGGKDSRVAIGFLEERGRLWRAVIKSTKEG